MSTQQWSYDLEACGLRMNVSERQGFLLIWFTLTDPNTLDSDSRDLVAMMPRAIVDDTPTFAQFPGLWTKLLPLLTFSDVLNVLELLSGISTRVSFRANMDLEQCLRSYMERTNTCSLHGLLAWKRSFLGTVTV
jgi:hypothetical protein